MATLGFIKKDSSISSLEFKNITNCGNSSIRTRTLQACEVNATGANIPSCRTGVTRLNYFPDPTNIEILQADHNSVGWNIVQFWIQNGRNSPFVPLLSSPYIGTTYQTALLTPTPTEFTNLGGTRGTQQFLDSMNAFFASQNLDTLYGFNAQPSVGGNTNSQFVIRTTVKNLSNYVFLMNRVLDGVENFGYGYAMDGGVPMRNVLGVTELNSGSTTWCFGPVFSFTTGTPQNVLDILYQTFPAYYPPAAQILGFSDCPVPGTPLDTSQQNDASAMNVLV